ncbi:hypothetical protein [Yersinia pestis]|uniref:hypothetical protein n=1 Tax=Yersinia pestis TaxID=632 RepID=UPI003B75B444
MKITIGILSMRWPLWIRTIESNRFWAMVIRRCGYQGSGPLYTSDVADEWGGVNRGGCVTVNDKSLYSLPLPLPLISIEYNRLSLQTTYIPGTYNNGNVLFTWIR